ncbi:MAG: hypothetical protein H6728_12970 [Myxococcales bacterium]|nr:hypothetical protein [Myxococcales bacterium]MCB9643980.1 hypothetical protein [Myxococcales bacterium]
MSTKGLLWGLFAAALVTFSPFLLVFLSWAKAGFTGNIWSEGPGGHGTAIWLMFFTLPAGFLISGTVVVLWLIKYFKS